MKPIRTTEEIFHIAKEQGLSRLRITHGKNGYAFNMGDYGIAGFDTFEQAHNFAEEHGLRVVCLQQKFGWDLWEIKGNRYRPFTYQEYLNDLGDDYSAFDKDTFKETVSETLINFSKEFDNDFKSIEYFIGVQKHILNMVDKCKQHEIVILNNGKYYETINQECLEYDYDSKRYCIAVLVERSSS